MSRSAASDGVEPAEQVAPFAGRRDRGGAAALAARQAGDRPQPTTGASATRARRPRRCRMLAGRRLALGERPAGAAGGADVERGHAVGHQRYPGQRAGCVPPAVPPSASRCARGRCPDDIAAAGAPRPASRRSPMRRRWQVSWLADRSPQARLPSRACSPVACDGPLSAYSCGGSRGLGTRTAFPFHLPVGRTIRQARPSGACPEPSNADRCHSPWSWAAPAPARAATPRRWSGASPPPWTYVATGRRRSTTRCGRASPRTGRARDAGWRTVEAPLDLSGALRGGARRRCWWIA